MGPEPVLSTIRRTCMGTCPGRATLLHGNYKRCQGPPRRRRSNITVTGASAAGFQTTCQLQPSSALHPALLRHFPRDCRSATVLSATTPPYLEARQPAATLRTHPKPFGETQRAVSSCTYRHHGGHLVCLHGCRVNVPSAPLPRLYQQEARRPVVSTFANPPRLPPPWL